MIVYNKQEPIIETSVVERKHSILEYLLASVWSQVQIPFMC